MASFALLAIQHGETADGSSSGGGNQREPALRTQSENYVSIGSPTSTPPEVVYTSENHRRTATDRNFFHPVNREKSQPLPIGREERAGSAFGAGDGLSLQAVHLSQVKLRRPTSSGHRGETSPVGRKGHRGGVRHDQSLPRRQDDRIISVFRE
jgi:hypothetical protein